ncbi:hypothetical protein GGR54DRAFT_429402 [Hypoxylon sp. NC1633]|nr:hypothetical protein GGR54DRAFT_429402 [Hypoxylon sp. NC1633]
MGPDFPDAEMAAEGIALQPIETALTTNGTPLNFTTSNRTGYLDFYNRSRSGVYCNDRGPNYWRTLSAWLSRRERILYIQRRALCLAVCINGGCHHLLMERNVSIYSDLIYCLHLSLYDALASTVGTGPDTGGIAHSSLRTIYYPKSISNTSLSNSNKTDSFNLPRRLGHSLWILPVLSIDPHNDNGRVFILFSSKNNQSKVDKTLFQNIPVGSSWSRSSL